MVATPPPAPPSQLGRWMLTAAGVLLVAVLARPVGELAYLLAAPPGDYIPDPGLQEWRVSGALLIGGLIAGALALGQGRRVPRIATTAMVVWLVWAAASSVWSIDRGVTVHQTFELAALTCVWGAGVHLAPHLRWRRAGAGVLAAGLAAMCLAAMYQYFYAFARIRLETFQEMGEWIGMVASDRLYSNRVYATFATPTVFGDYLAVLIPVAVAGAIGYLRVAPKGRLSLPRVAPFMLPALALWCLVLTTGRGAWLGTAAALGLLIVWRLIARLFRRRGAAAALAAIAFALAWPSHAQEAPQPPPQDATDFVAGMDPAYFTGGLPELEQLLSTRTLSMRRSYWRATMAMVRDRPLAGVGWGAWASAYPRYTVRGGWPTQLAHNNYLQMLAELGPVGLLCFVTVLAMAFVGGLRHVRLAPTTFSRWLWAGCTCSVVAFALHSLTDFALYMPAVSWPTFAIFGALHSAPRAEPPPTTAPRPLAGLIAVAASLLALALWQQVAATERDVRDARVLRDGGRAELARDVAVQAMVRAPWHGAAAEVAAGLIAATTSRGTGPGWHAALDAYARAERLQPLSPWVPDSYADALMQVAAVQRNPAYAAEALAQRERAVANYPVHPDLRARLAQTAGLLGREDLAAQHAALAEELRPEYHFKLERE